MNILQGFLSVMTGYGQDGGYINPGVYWRESVLYLRYEIEDGIYGNLPGLSRISKQLGRILGDLSVFSYFGNVFSRLIAGHCWTDGFNPATASIGCTVDESLVDISRFPKGPLDDSLDVGAAHCRRRLIRSGLLFGSLESLASKAEERCPGDLGALGDPLPQRLPPGSLPVNQELVPAPSLAPVSA